MRSVLQRFCWDEFRNLDPNTTTLNLTGECQQCFNGTSLYEPHTEWPEHHREQWELKLRLSLLIISNFFLAPAFYISIRAHLYAEAVLYLFVMFISSFYHACDEPAFAYCILSYDTLQFCDFYYAMLTPLITAIAVSELNEKIQGALRMAGIIILAILVQNSRMGIVTFITAGALTVGVLIVGWTYKFFVLKERPQTLTLDNGLPCAVLTIIGLTFFIIQQKYESLYGYFHSCWHACVSLAVGAILPRDFFCLRRTKTHSFPSTSSLNPIITSIYEPNSHPAIC